MWLNFFPPIGGVCPTLCPQAITGLHPDGARHCQIPFGGYAQVHAEPDPTNDAMVSRTVGGISLGPTGNIQGTYKFLSLLTGRQIEARAFTPLPMPAEVIQRVETLAQHGQQNITFEDRNGNPDHDMDHNPDYDPDHAYPEDDVSLQADHLAPDEVALLALPENEGVDLPLPAAKTNENDGVGDNIANQQENNSKDGSNDEDNENESEDKSDEIRMEMTWETTRAALTP